ncbi:MAG: hypothetical protein AAGJ32_04205 [Pseudomonadota bacterium]
MGFRFFRFRRKVVLDDPGLALKDIPLSPLEESRTKALARDRFDRADLSIQNLAANDEPQPGTDKPFKRAIG